MSQGPNYPGCHGSYGQVNWRGCDMCPYKQSCKTTTDSIDTFKYMLKKPVKEIPFDDGMSSPSVLGLEEK